MSGYTRIPNVIIESMFTEMNATEQAMCVYLCRYTFGFKRTQFEATKAKMIKAGVGSKASVLRNWDSKIVAEFFGKEDNVWVSKVSLNGDNEGIKSIPSRYQKDTIEVSKVSHEGIKSIPSTSGLKKIERKLKENLKKDDLTLSSETFQEYKIDSDPLSPHWAREADMADEFRKAVSENSLLWKMIKSETKHTGNRQSRFPEFVEVFPNVEAADITFWIEREWPKHNFYKPGQKPPLGVLINDFTPQPTAGEANAQGSVQTWVNGERDSFVKIPAYFQNAIKVLKINPRGMSVYEAEKTVTRIMNYAG
jgi:hypothetical protein